MKRELKDISKGYFLKITKIELKDIFSYYGETEIELSNINAILGENGFGKTSLLNALKLAFGSNFNRERVLNRASENSIASIKVCTDKFNIYREFVFDKTKYISEKLEIEFSKTKIYDQEAEEFLNDKFSNEILDFIFFDGELENITIFNNNALRKLLFNVFDLDILENMEKDLKRVKARFVTKLNSSELDKFKDLNSRQVETENIIIETQKSINSSNKSIQKVIKGLDRVEKAIEKENSEISLINTEIVKKEEERNLLVSEFYNLNLYQLPLILNQKLYKNIVSDKKNLITINDESGLRLKLEDLYLKIKPEIDKSIFIELFYSTILNPNSDIRLNSSKDELLNLLNKISNISKSINSLEKSKKDMINNSASSKLTLLEESKKEYLLELENLNIIQSELEIKLKEAESNLKDIKAQLRIEFIKKREQFATLKSIEEIDKEILLANKLLIQEAQKSIVKFNIALQNNLKAFYLKYLTIKDIRVNRSFQVNIDESFLSAGQKQIVNFIFIKTLLGVVNFTDTIFIDTPFGRLSKENRELILEIYKSFPNLTLLLTNSEIEAINIDEFKLYEIVQNMKGSKIVSKNLQRS